MDVFAVNNALSLMPLVVLESPCAANATSTWEENQAYLAEALRDSIGHGEAPIASHGLFAFSNIFDDATHERRQRCMYAGWAWIKCAARVVVYADLGITPGMEAGITYARSIGIPVIYRRLRGEEDFVPPAQ